LAYSAGGTIIHGWGHIRTLALGVERLVLAVADISESALTIFFLSLYLPIDKPECVNMTREITQDCQTDVDEQVTAATRYEPSCCGWEEDRNDDEDDVGSFDHCDLLVQIVVWYNGSG